MKSDSAIKADKVGQLRIAFLVDTFPVISQTFILDQITGLLDLGQDVDIYAISRVGGPRHAEVELYNLLERTHFLGRPATKRARLVKMLSQILQGTIQRPGTLLKTLSNGGGWRQLEAGLKMLKCLEYLGRDGAYYDIIHCHFATVGMLFLLLKHVLPAKYITSFHASMPFDCGKPATKAYRGLFCLADRIIANSSYTSKYLVNIGCPADKIIILSPGLNLGKYPLKIRMLEPGSPVQLLTVSRLTEVKGLEYSIRAVAKLAQRYHIQYKIVGDGVLRPSLENLIHQLGLFNTISLLGECSREGVSKLMNEAHLFILPSITSHEEGQETAGCSLREAMASGVPVVASNSGGIPESVIDGTSGFLVPERDVDALAERLEFLINHPDIWPEIGRAGHRSVEEKYNLNRQNEKLLQVYRSLIN